MQLRPYQQQIHDDILAGWQQGARVVMAQLPTGGGKTVTFSHIVAETDGPTTVMAHRRELIVQMSVALAREGVRHRVFGPDMLARLCSASHMEDLGANYINPQAHCAVASVQTLAAWKGDTRFFSTVRRWVGDEGHHYLRENQFGRVVTSLFPNAQGLLVTATPGRADGQGLGSHADGLADVLVQGPGPAWMIAQGYLSRYKIFAPPSTLKRAALHVGASGDFNAAEVRDATRRSSVMGDIVEHYCRHASGKLGLTFADSIENATTIVEKFRAAGVPAELITGKTPDALRTGMLRRFRARQILQLVSVSLIDEGFDCPGVEVVSDGAPTASLSRYLQRFGRALRILPGKEYAMYFDHVGNTSHGLPDAPRRWSLDRRDKRKSTKADDVTPVRSCPQCTAVYERVHRECPFCGHYPEPAARNGPAQVDGDLQELDANTHAAMLGDVARVDGGSYAPDGVDRVVAMAIAKRHRERQVAQAELRETMALWGGWRVVEGDTVSAAQRRFWFSQGVDVLTAQTLGAREAGELNQRLRDVLAAKGVR